MDLGLKGKCALVTGGSMGIGRAAALALGEEGCRVAIAARGREALAQAVGHLRDFGKLSGFVTRDGDDGADLLADEIPSGHGFGRSAMARS